MDIKWIYNTFQFGRFLYYFGIHVYNRQGKVCGRLLWFTNFTPASTRPVFIFHTFKTNFNISRYAFFN